MLVKSKIKYIQSLGQKKQRDAEGVFIAEGPKIVNEFILLIPGSIIEIFATKNWIDQHRGSHHSNVTEISETDLEKISQLATPHEVLAVIKKFEPPLPVNSKGKVSIVLDGIQDPGNLGTIIRIADWYGIDQIVCSCDSADIYNPKVVQATMGSIARVAVIYTELKDWLVKQEGIPVYAMMLEGRDVTTMEKITEGIIVAGNESKGIHPGLATFATEKITIRGKGKAESLNAGVALGIVVSHLV